MKNQTALPPLKASPKRNGQSLQFGDEINPPERDGPKCSNEERTQPRFIDDLPSESQNEQNVDLHHVGQDWLLGDIALQKQVY